MAGQTIYDPTEVTTDSRFALHTLAFTDGTKGHIYVQANGTLAVGDVCAIGHDGQVRGTSTTRSDDEKGLMLGVVVVAMPDNSYGWLQVYGVGSVAVTADTTDAGEQLYTTSTGGGLSVTASTGIVNGIFVVDRSSAGNADAFLSFPTIQGA